MKKKMKPIVDKKHFPIIQKAKIYLEKLQKGKESKNLFKFLLREMCQITPEEFHYEGGVEQRNLGNYFRWVNWFISI